MEVIRKLHFRLCLCGPLKKNPSGEAGNFWGFPQVLFRNQRNLRFFFLSLNEIYSGIWAFLKRNTKRNINMVLFKRNTGQGQLTGFELNVIAISLILLVLRVVQLLLLNALSVTDALITPSNCR